MGRRGPLLGFCSKLFIRGGAGFVMRSGGRSGVDVVSIILKSLPHFGIFFAILVYADLRIGLGYRCLLMLCWWRRIVSCHLRVS